MGNEKRYEYKNSKSIFGIKEIDNKKYFYKKTKNLQKELDGYNEINKIYKTPKIMYCDKDEILYEYKSELQTKTIHEYLYNNKNLRVNYQKILSQYQKSINAFVIKKESLFRNSDFFIKRINMLSNCQSLELFNKVYVFENKEYEVNKILEDIKQNIASEKVLKGILTLGDPTDTNISTTGLFTDFECAGYNSLIGEIAIFFISFFTHGSYFYPKYNSNAYIQRTSLLFNYNKYRQKVIYFEDPDGKCILLPDFKIPKKNKKVILKFLKFYNKYFSNDIEINKYLKYYICMRILTPLDINKMDEYDKHLIVALLICFYEHCKDINSLILFIKSLKVEN